MRPTAWRRAATRCTSCRAITATAATSETIDGVHYHFVRDSRRRSIAGLPAVMLRGLWHYEGARRVLAAIGPDIVHHHSRPGGSLAEQGRRAEGHAR